MEVRVKVECQETNHAQDLMQRQDPVPAQCTAAQQDLARMQD